jgi:hypothetical protein
MGIAARGPLGLAAGFVLRALLFYGLLVLLWPVVRHEYGRVYGPAAERLAGVLELRQPIWLRPYGGPDPRVNHFVLTREGRRGEVRTYLHRSEHLSYMAGALLAALVLATPVAWSQRSRLLLAGFLLLGLYLTVRLGLHFRLTFGAPSLAPASRLLLATLAYAPWYVAPVAVWLFLAPWRLRGFFPPAAGAFRPGAPPARDPAHGARGVPTTTT